MKNIVSVPSAPRDQVAMADIETREPSSLRLETMLTARSRDRSLPKRERTRALLLSVAAGYIQDEPAGRLSVEAIVDEAGVARGTFYNHFRDVDDLKSELVRQFIQDIWRAPSRRGRRRSSYDAIYETNMRYCRSYQANAGLFALFSDMATQDAELLKLREQINADWVEKVVAAIARRRGYPFGDEERRKAEGAIRLLVAMSIESLRERYVDKDPMLCRLLPTTESLAEMLSQIWHRVISDYETGRT